MVKKTHRRPLREYRLPRAEQPKEESGINFKEILSILAGSSGVFAALFWMGGRFFAMGYFQSLDIPLYMLTFTFGEYGEQYFGTLLLLPIVIGNFILANYFIVLKFVLILSALVVLIVLGKILIRSRFKIDRKAAGVPSPKTPNKVFWVFDVIVLLILTFYFAFFIGNWSGRDVVLAKSQEITFYTQESMGEIEFSQVSPNASTTYKYSGLRLLTKNSGKYYLYDDVNPDTCKPARIYIVDEEKMISVTLVPGSPFDIPSCSSFDIFTYFGN